MLLQTPNLDRFQSNNQFQWKTLSSKVVFEHSRLTLLEDEVLLPTGHRTIYLRKKDNGNGVTIIAQRADNKFLLQTEYSYPCNRILYQFPGGFVPHMEDLGQGAIREFIEETKYKPEDLSLLGKYLTDNRRSNAMMYVYLATDLRIVNNPTKFQDHEEQLEHFWLDYEEIESLIQTGRIEIGTALAAWAIYRSVIYNAT